MVLRPIPNHERKTRTHREREVATMANSETSRTERQARDARVIVGITKRLQTPVVLGGVSYTPAALTAVLQHAIDSANQVTSTRGQWLAAVQADRAMASQTAKMLTGLQEHLRQLFNNDPEALADFGFAPKKKPAAQTVAEKVVAVAMRASTRAARHTMGSKQRLEIKGTLTGPVVIPVGPAATAPTPSARLPDASEGIAAGGVQPPAATNGPAEPRSRSAANAQGSAGT